MLWACCSIAWMSVKGSRGRLGSRALWAQKRFRRLEARLNKVNQEKRVLTLALAGDDITHEVHGDARLGWQVGAHFNGQELVDGFLRLKLGAEALDGDGLLRRLLLLL